MLFLGKELTVITQIEKVLYTARTHTTGGGHLIQARLNVSLPGIDRETAQKLVDGAHQECPYSKATHGNINVETNVIDADVATPVA